MSQTGMGTNTPKSDKTGSPELRSEAEHAAEQAREAMRATLDDVKGTVKDSANTVLKGLSSAATDAKHQASELVGEAKSRVYGIVEQQKNAGADQIGGIAEAVHSAADDLQERAPSVARYVHDAASGIERVSDGLRHSTVDDIVGQVERFARTQPLAFFGAAALAGFAVSRFVKSSADRRMEQAMGESGEYRPGSTNNPRSSGEGTVSAVANKPLGSAPSMQKPAASTGTRTDPGSVTSRGAEPVKGFDPKHI